MARLETELAETLAEEDVLRFGAVMAPGSFGAVLVYENLWAAHFGAGVRHAGGQLIANGRSPVQAIIAAIEAEPSWAQEPDMPLRPSRIGRAPVVGAAVTPGRLGHRHF